MGRWIDRDGYMWTWQYPENNFFPLRHLFLPFAPPPHPSSSSSSSSIFLLSLDKRRGSGEVEPQSSTSAVEKHLTRNNSDMLRHKVEYLAMNKEQIVYKYIFKFIDNI